MPPIETACLTDHAVLLEALDYDRYGRIKVSDVPIEINCRWVEDVVSQSGNAVDTEGIMAQVYVDRDITLSSILWHGRLADFPKDWVNDAPYELMEVANYHKVPDITGRVFARYVDLTRYRDELPTQE